MSVKSESEELVAAAKKRDFSFIFSLFFTGQKNQIYLHYQIPLMCSFFSPQTDGPAKENK